MDTKGFATRVKELREKRALSQVQLAKMVGISQVAIKKIEDGGNTRYGRKLAEALGVSLEYLETGVGAAEIDPPHSFRLAERPTKWPFGAIPEAAIHSLKSDELSRVEGAMLLVLAQLGIDLQDAKRLAALTPIASQPQAKKFSGLMDIDEATDEFPMFIGGGEAAPWEPGGQTTKQMERAAVSLRLSQVANVGHVARAGYSANDQEFMAIPELDVRLAAGMGIENYHESAIGEILLRRSFLESFKLPTERMKIVYAHGDSMEPVIRNEGPMLFYAEPVTDPRLIDPRTVYAINYGGEMIVKCIERKRDGTWLAISLNPEFAPFPLAKDDGRDVQIVGRILWSPYDLRNGVDGRLLPRS